MDNEIKLSRIEIFSYLDPPMVEILEQAFIRKTLSRGDYLVVFGKEVSGLFILIEGEVTVMGQDNKTALGVLKKGACFGEMSFLKDGYMASASIIVSSDHADVYFCRKEIFARLLLKEPKLSFAFYKGAAIVIADRLRKMDSKITEGYQFVSAMLDESELDMKLGKTRLALDKSGDNLVSQLAETLPAIENVSRTHPSARRDLKEIRDKIESVIFSEGQNLDRLAQQLDHILQHFQNLRRIAEGETPEPIRGDQSIFKDLNS